MPSALAIDFGTSRTKAAYRDPRTGKPELMRLGHDQPFAPSLFYLSPDDEQILWGFDAEEQLEDDPVGIVEVLKRRLQERYVRANRRRVGPGELLTLLFSRLREQAGHEVPAFQGTPPRQVYLTVPVLYGAAVEKLLRESAQAAGFAEVVLITEPVAAARAWLTETGESGRSVVVLDCGGGTLDWACLRYQDNEFHLVPDCPPGGDVRVGGHDVDQELLRHLRDLVEDDDREIEARQPWYLQQVRVLKERYCRGLPLRPIRVGGRPVPLDKNELQAVLRERYVEQACTHLEGYLEKVRPVDRQPTVLLVGGSARITGLKEAIEARCGCRALWWERSEYATVLGAVPAAPRPVPKKTPSLPRLKLPPLTFTPGTVFRDTLKDGSPGPEMVVIPAGRFLMGSPEDEAERSNDERQHKVTIEQPFALGKYPVTFEEFDRFYKPEAGYTETGIFFVEKQSWGRGRQPVINVNWHEAMAYCQWLSEQTGQAYRLPSEAEWEYACRAGTVTPFHFGDTISTKQANYDGNYTYGNGAKGEYRQQTTPVGQFPANAWGLHDMHGNVWEWTCSIYDANYGGAEQRCASASESGPRVVRGGSWLGNPRGVRSAFRLRFVPADRDDSLGLRLSRSP